MPSSEQRSVRVSRHCGYLPALQGPGWVLPLSLLQAGDTAFCCNQGQGDREAAVSSAATPDTTSYPGPGEAARTHGHTGTVPVPCGNS